MRQIVCRRNSVVLKDLAALAAAICFGWSLLGATPAWAQRPSTEKHVRELARYLDGVKIAEPITYRQLAVYPVIVDDVPLLRGHWLTLDKAISRGILDVSEKSGGTVPVVRVGNKSRDENVLIMTGEVIAGGMQTRTIRHDVVLAPGQTIDLDVFCVEAHRWAGEGKFSGGSQEHAPAVDSRGSSQRGRPGQGLVGSRPQEFVPEGGKLHRQPRHGPEFHACPQEAGGCTAANRSANSQRYGRFHLRGPRPGIGRRILWQRRPRPGAVAQAARFLRRGLRDSARSDTNREVRSDNRTAIEFFEQVCRTGSQRTTTPGSGAGIRTRQGDLLGDGVSLDDAPVHYGVQFVEGNEPKPNQRPRPSIIYPNPAQQQQGEMNQR